MYSSRSLSAEPGDCFRTKACTASHNVITIKIPSTPPSKLNKMGASFCPLTMAKAGQVLLARPERDALFAYHTGGRSFSSTLRILSSIVWSRSTRVPKCMVVEVRGTPISCRVSWQRLTALKTASHSPRRSCRTRDVSSSSRRGRFSYTAERCRLGRVNGRMLESQQDLRRRALSTSHVDALPEHTPSAGAGNSLSWTLVFGFQRAYDP